MLAPVLLVVLCWSLYQQIILQPDLKTQWHNILYSFAKPAFWLVVVMMVANWGLETIKWILLMGPVEKLNFGKAFSSVLAGCSITLVTPNRIGEYGGRILFVKPENRIKGISLTILGSISQLIITLVAGIVGLLILKISDENSSKIFEHLPGFLDNILLVASVFSLLFLILIYMNVGWFVRLAEKVKMLRSFMKHVRVLDELNGKQLLSIIVLSFLRYMVFILQYILMLKVMNVQVDWSLSFWIMTVFFLVMAMAPTIGFLELPIRATATVELFGMYSSNIIGIQAAAFSIWIINLAIPALIGSILVFGIKLFKER